MDGITDRETQNALLREIGELAERQRRARIAVRRLIRFLADDSTCGST